MRILVQRVREARVEVSGTIEAQIGAGLLLFVGFGKQDDPDFLVSRGWLALCDKIWGLRVFPDAQGRFDLDVVQYGGGVLAVPQFTLYANCRRGRRPSFDAAAGGEAARQMFDGVCQRLEHRGGVPIGRGVFGADMEVGLTNWGPVTLWLDSLDFL
ncbi:D-aminoacyl-tRNA deacylase [Desulfohalobium retbaense]|uniref:D-tyrosyl-tRNA(Tyr) deacylase n=1 Tax=Desulfohalobium retbaense (strain ATCC 49708 / DSM 5692 / JCM 16813 / HR100) TaxID=485915 RepID=C8X2N4_DESRD|nr:D-aminoacyl-tRNA deacylase [Desulfohalobium retbaense]ACV68681.1 D-tyrosyl-tRNA(Tyr) deacylase [Desulfohalobium retbaense DSM 5692]